MPKETLDITVAGCIINSGKLLLIHHQKLDKWLPVGGHIDENETPDDALLREVKEEVGLDIEFVHYPSPRRGNQNQFALPFYVNKHHITEDHLHYNLFYLCSSKRTEIKIAEKELKGYRWVEEKDLRDLRPEPNEGDLITYSEAIRLGKKLRL